MTKEELIAFLEEESFSWYMEVGEANYPWANSKRELASNLQEAANFIRNCKC